jgi:multidrug efflux system membrane fusion protein
MPAPGLQRGPNGLFAWVITADNTADQRPIEASMVDKDTVIVTRGLNPGDKVVVNGAYRLQKGTRVDAKPQSAQQAAAGDRS